jgi:hypothetical protein
MRPKEGVHSVTIGEDLIQETEKDLVEVEAEEILA